ncbi:MAG: sigma-70 family RNA polymerase sigma factor, partial [Actinomycetota bacterium]|nr:sigma-70 family RNA polymerase sigma factor [Actinomycetota bacterium]
MTSRLQTSPSGADDGTLARAAAAGDRAAFAQIYDRYADRLHDFCIGMLRDRDAAADCVQDTFVTAATKLIQLREPDRLRPWLYAIARSEALARIRDRKRERPSEELPDMPSDEADPATLAARGELAELISQASGGLSDRDRVVLELAYRQGLDGPELAEALGVTPKNANTLVERLRDTIARSLGALLLYRGVTADPERCAELAAIVGQGDGEFTVLMRKRVARHIDGCRVCEEDRARMVTPAALLGATPIVVPAPAWLRQRTLDSAVVPPPTTTSAPVGPEDDASWWPPRDLDVDDLAEPPKPSRMGQSGSAIKGRPARAGIGAALILVGIGGGAFLAAPAAFRVVPADSNESITATSAAVTTASRTATSRSIVERTAPSNSPSELPPPVTTTVFIAPTTITTEPATTESAVPRTHDQTPESTPATTRPTPTNPQDDDSPDPVIDLPPIFDPPTDAPVTTPPPKTKPTKPTVTVSRPPPVKVDPSCPPQDT